MKYITSFIIFCLILFIYLHVQFQLKTSDDLEIYEVDDTSKDKLEEICDLRQPVLFDFKNEQIIAIYELKAFEFKLKLFF